MVELLLTRAGIDVKSPILRHCSSQHATVMSIFLIDLLGLKAWISTELDAVKRRWMLASTGTAARLWRSSLSSTKSKTRRSSPARLLERSPLLAGEGTRISSGFYSTINHPIGVLEAILLTHSNPSHVWRVGRTDDDFTNISDVHVNIWPRRFQFIFLTPIRTAAVSALPSAFHPGWGNLDEPYRNLPCVMGIASLSASGKIFLENT